MGEVIIRKFNRDDREAVRKIAWETAFMGEPGSAFFDSEEILSEFLIQYFTDYEPQSCFIAEAENRAVGYLIGTKDIRQLEGVFRDKIFKPLLRRAFSSGAFLKIKNLTFGFNCLISVLRREFVMPDFSKDYPATLHINLEKYWRGQNIGSKLISAYLDYLSRERVRGVHLATMSNRAAGFFSQRGFNLLHQANRSYFRYILKKDIPIYVYGKKF